MDNYKELDKQYIMGTYKRADLLIKEGMGSVCYDENNREYIDLGSGIGVNCLGYCDIEWVSAIAQQTCKLSHASNLYYTEPSIKLAKLLCNKTGYSKVFFANSGAEANECAIKLARKYSMDKYGEGRNKIVTLVNSFHGRTMATLTATGQETFHQHFMPFLQGFDYATANDIEDTANKLDNTTCALIIELVQGEGGVNALDINYVKAVEELCRSKDILLIVDEVQTGVGRTGKFLASQHYGIMPNITTLAKGLGGGLPIGAVLCDNSTQEVLGFSAHGSTFGGNPIVCAGAISIIERMTDEFLQEVAEKGEYIQQVLRSSVGISSVSGLGMMIGFMPTNLTAQEVAQQALKSGVIVLTAKEKVRLLPPLNIPEEELERALYKLIHILEN